MYQEVLQIIAILSITGLGLYPVLFKKNTSWKWHVKGVLGVATIYTISLFIVFCNGIKMKKSPTLGI